MRPITHGGGREQDVLIRMESKVRKTTLDAIEGLVVRKGSLGPFGKGANRLQALKGKRLTNPLRCYG